MKLSKLKIYMEMAHTVKKLSPDSETQVGAVMLSSEDRIIATSFNGFVRGAPDDKLPNTRPHKYEYMQHAETNMIYNCASEGIKSKGSTIVCTLSPCLSCLRACYQSNINTIIFDELYHKFPSTNFYTQLMDLNVDITPLGKYTMLKITPRHSKEIV